MPRIEYRNKEGTRLPSVTTIISQNLGWNKRALMHWAWNEGMETRDYRETSGRAADVGTIAHHLVECDLKELPFDPSPWPETLVAKAEPAFNAWQEWRALVDFKTIASEISLVSEEHQFGGTIDVAAIKNKHCILDLKTSNGVYADHLVQISAYGRLWNENYPGDPKIEGFYLLRLGKHDGSFHYHYWPQLDDAWEVFQHLLRLHHFQKQIKA